MAVGRLVGEAATGENTIRYSHLCCVWGDKVDETGERGRGEKVNSVGDRPGLGAHAWLLLFLCIVAKAHKPQRLTAQLLREAAEPVCGSCVT